MLSFKLRRGSIFSGEKVLSFIIGVTLALGNLSDVRGTFSKMDAYWL